MSQEQRWTERWADHLRWALPLSVSVVGIAYSVLTQVLPAPFSLSPVVLARDIAVLGLAVPLLVWLGVSRAIEAATVTSTANDSTTASPLSQETAQLNAVGEAVSRFLVEEKVLEAAVDVLTDLLGAPAAAIWLTEDSRLVLRAHQRLPQAGLLEESPLSLGRCVCGQSASAGKTIVLSDPQLSEMVGNCPCTAAGYQSVAAVPMRTKGMVMGVMQLASPEAEAFTTLSEGLLTALADRVATAIENAWLYEEAHRRSVYLEAASAIARRVTALTDLDTLLADVAALIRGKFGYHRTQIFLVDSDGKYLVLREACGPTAAVVKELGLRLEIGKEGITGRVAHTGQAMLCNDVSREPVYYGLELQQDTRSELAMPMRLGRRIIGVLDVHSDRVDAFDQQDMTILQIIGTQVAIAIENARLFRETSDRYEAVVALHKVSLDMLSQLDLQQLLEALLERGVRLLNAQASCLFIYDAEQGLIRNVANYNTWRDWTGVTVRPGEGVIGQVVQTGQPLIVNDYSTWECRADSFSGAPTTVVMGAPLKFRDRVMGGIIALKEPADGTFDEDDLWLLEMFADSATCAISNAELYTEIRGLSERLERKVGERTAELLAAQEELAAKAQQLSSLLARTVGIQEEERRRIAHDMHDSVVQLVAATRLELEAARVAAGPALAGSASEKLAAARELLGEAEQELRRAIHNLTPATLNTMDLPDALRYQASDFQRLTGVSCRLEVRGNPEPLPAATEVAVFRVVQEALHNVSRHAEAGTALIELDFGTDTVEVMVEDDGRGFDYRRWARRTHQRHIGLLGMQERAESLGGELQVYSQEGEGTRIVMRLPMGASARQVCGWDVPQSQDNRSGTGR